MPADTFMTCGCAANAKRPDGSPACVIHECFEVSPVAPDLAGRVARCVYYGRNTSLNSRYSRNECNYGHDKDAKCSCEQPSAAKLPLFEYRGSGSTYATDCKHCGCSEGMHPRPRCSKYEPRGGVEHDRFYCGCNGWD